MAKPSKGTKKDNNKKYATWNTTRCKAVQLVSVLSLYFALTSSIYFPLHMISQ